MPVGPSFPIARRQAARIALGAAAATTLGALRPAQAQAQAQPQPIAGGRPIRLVVPYPAGGAVDLVGRLYSERMEPLLGQQVVVDNRSGGAGIVGAEYVAKARPDGTTLGVIGMTTLCAYKTLYSRLPFDPDRDFAPISQLSAGTVVCAVNKAAAARHGWTDFRSLINWARENPEGLRYGTAGIGTTAHLTMAAVQKATGIKALHVTYRGAAPAVTDLQSGTIDMMFELTPALMPLIAQGEVTPLAVGSGQRVALLPAIPGMSEFADLGLGALDIGAWEALMAPAGTAPELIAQLHAAALQAGKDTRLAERMRDVGFLAEPSASPQALAEKIRHETPVWRQLVEASGARLD
ncbi:Bug family tripartite tricarboxylate transporter substrate binding protein [Roseomonas sp. WA12]